MTSDNGATFSTMKRLLAAAAGALFVAALAQPAISSAASAAKNTSFPMGDGTNLEMHTTANCVLADAQCYFTAAANLMTPDGPTGFPDDLWARQTTTIRSTDRDNYLNTDFNAPNTRMFKSIGPVELTTVYFGGGPVEKYQIVGNTWPTDWQTGRPKTDADYIVCSQIQVVYGGKNITSPSTCSQTRF